MLPVVAALACACTPLPTYIAPDPTTPVARIRYVVLKGPRLSMYRHRTPDGQCLPIRADDKLPDVDFFDGGKKIGMPSLDKKREIRGAETYFPGGTTFTAQAIYGDGDYPGWQYSCQPIVRFIPEAGKDYEFNFDFVVLKPGQHRCIITLDELRSEGSKLERIPVHFDEVLPARSPLCRGQ